MKKLRSICLVLAMLLAFACFAACGGGEGTDSGNMQAFIDAVEAIETVDKESAGEIEAAEELYRKLSADEQMNVDVIKAYDKLESYREQYETLLDAEADAQIFINYVNRIPDPVTLNSLSTILTAENSYAQLSEAAKAEAGVAEAYAKLTAARAEYERLKAEQELEEAKEDAAAFISLAEAVPPAEQITRYDELAIERAESAYEALSDLAKEQSGVAEAAAAVAAARERYEYLVAHPEEADEIEIAAFVAQVDALTSQEITLGSLDAIRAAERGFRYLSATAKQDERALAANVKLVAARAEYDALYETQQAEAAAEEFIAAVEALPEAGDVVLSDISEIEAVQALYDALPEAALALDDVVSAKAALDAVKEAFDSLEKEALPAPNATGVGFSGDIPPYVLLWGVTYDDLAALYGVPVEELGDKMEIVINIYFADEEDPDNYFTQYVDNRPFTYPASEQRGHIFYNDYIINALVEASKTVEGLESGTGTFRFSAYYRDKTGMYSDSEMTAMSEVSPEEHPYMFTPAAKPTGEVYEIYDLEDLLAVGDHLNDAIELKADIDVSGVPVWHHLGQLNGVFDGNGHKIYGLTCNEASRTEEERESDPRGTTIFALFETMSSTAVVKNLALYGTVENAGSWAGSVVIDNNGGLISNCYIELTVTALGSPDGDGFGGDGYIGGVCANNNGTIEYCIVNSKIVGTGTQWEASGMVSSGAFATGIDANNGKILHSYANGDRLTDKVSIANAPALFPDLIKSEVELMNPELYEGWDTSLWDIRNGYIPTLKVQE